MKKFLLQILIFSILALTIVVISLEISSYIVESRDFKNSETESNTLIIKDNEQYDILFLGISHARNFSRHRNHEMIEYITGNKIINIGQGGGACGLNEQKFYLNYFYSKGNKTGKIIFVLSPPLFYSETLPVASNTFSEECFSFDFLFSYFNAESENKKERIVEYLRSKFSKKWINKKPFSKSSETKALKSLDQKTVKEGFTAASGDTLSVTRFEKSCITAEEIIQLANNHNSKVIFLVPPALFGKWPGHDSCIEFAKRMEVKYGCKYYDFSEAITTPSYYYDHHHLNSKGVEYFARTFLNPIIN
ncbi:MAG: hypothetical protein J0L87_10250 [Bacteroidetes bacterium]|nr:hypothetical protein [Bacteroidota bacterium]